jgi:WD40 repeat protein
VSVFISYCRKDIEFVRRLEATLAARDRKTWVDWNDIAPTADWLQKIDAAITGAVAVVFVISPDFVSSEVCAKEVVMAVQGNKRLIPILLHESNATVIPAPLARLNWLMFRAEDDFEAAVSRLIQALDTDLPWVESHTRMLVRAREWRERGQEPSLTLRGADLKAAEQWLAVGPSREPPPNELQTRYVLESQRASTRRRLLRAAMIAAALAIVSVLGYAWQAQRREAALQEANAVARRLTSSAQRLRESKWEGDAKTPPPLLALQLLAQAQARLAASGLRSLEADIETRRALQHSPTLERKLTSTYASDTRRTTALAFRSDGRLSSVRHRMAFETWSLGDGVSSGLTQDAGSSDANPVFSADGRFLVTHRQLEDEAIVHDTSNGHTVRRLRHPGEAPSSYAMGPQGRNLLLTLSRTVGKQWLHRTLLYKDPTQASDAPMSVKGLPALHSSVISPDGRFVAAQVYRGDDSVLCVWSLESLGRGDSRPLVELGRMVGPQFSPDSTHLAAQVDGPPDEVVVWAVEGWQELSRLAHERLIALGPEGRLIAVGSTKKGDYATQIVDRFGGLERAQLFSPVMDAPVVFSADGQHVAVGLAGGVEVWRTDSRASAAAQVQLGEGFKALAFDTADSAVAVLTLNPQGRVLTLKRFDAATGRMLGSSKDFELPTTNPPAQFSADGTTFAYVAGHVVRRVDVRSGEPIGADLSALGATDIALSPDGRTVAVATHAGAFQVWPPSASEPIVIELGGELHGSFFAPDNSGGQLSAVTAGKAMRTGNPLTLHLRELALPKPTVSMPLGRTSSGLSTQLCGLGPGGQRAAFAIDSSTLRVVDIRSGRDIAVLEEAGGAVHCRFSHDQRWLLVTSMESTVRVWDLNSSTEVARLDEIEGPRAVALSDDGRWLAAVERGGRLSVWPLLPADLLARLCEQAPADMTQANWERFFGSLPYKTACSSAARSASRERVAR